MRMIQLSRGRVAVVDVCHVFLHVGWRDIVQCSESPKQQFYVNSHHFMMR